MSFGNPIIGGNGTLVRQAMQSEGFQSGVTGWRVTREGDAEFNDVVVRGDLDVGTATQYVKVYRAPPPIDGPAIVFNSDRTTYTDGFIRAIPSGPGGAYATLFLSSPEGTGQSAAQLTLESGSGAKRRVIGVSGDLNVNGDLSVEPAAGSEVLRAGAAGVTVTGSLTVSGVGQRQTATTSADQTRTNSTALLNTALTLPVVSGGVYTGRAVIWYTATASNDLVYAWSVPSGTTGKRGTLCPDISSPIGNAITVNDRVSGAFSTLFECGGSNGFFRQAREEMQLTAGADGAITLQFAQRLAASGTSATILANSFFTLERIA
ncbi:hypothetical protein [Actinomadura geliboluensis]|uniref:hypothetical protein n=1 Tax=Actinomadura geliboluensis TaxID=882440 RepID=UPI00367D37D5